LGNADLKLEDAVSVYPNPTSGKVNVAFSLNNKIIPKKPPTVGSSGHPAYSARVVASSGIHPHAVQ
jgi:hypothetical protein